MRGYLLDTDAVSMLAPDKMAPASFRSWLEEAAAAERIFLSSVTVHEIEKGIGLLEHKRANRKAAALRA